MRKSSETKSPQFTRRAVLRGAGVTMALPFLPSLQAWADTPPASAFPKRLSVQFMGNGINENFWSATGQGADMVLSKSLEPLEPLKQKINYIDGLFIKEATGKGIHPPMTGSLLSGAHIQKGAIIRSGISIDQLIAAQMGDETPQPSVTLACEAPMTGYHETNYSLAYSSHISWQTPDSPVPVELYPSLAFDTLFENSGSLRNESILDRVRDRAQSLSTQISATDKAKLDEYLTSVRDVEKRVEAMRKTKDTAEDAAKTQNKALFTMDRPANGLPEDLRDHTRLMCDIIAMGFQTDKTRVATLLQARDLSAMYYPFLDVKGEHHGESHNNTSDGYERITRFHLSQFAYLATKLDSMPEGDGTVLDHSCLMFLSNMFIGRKHDNSKLPVVLAGGLSGTLKTGRTFDFYKAGDENRRMCALYLGLLRRFGVHVDQFGDAADELKDL
jgi:hypothetical protein